MGALGLPTKLQFANRRARHPGHPSAPSEKMMAIASKPPTPKTDADRKLMFDAILKNEALDMMFHGHVEKKRIDELIETAVREEFEAGSIVIQLGDKNADYF